MSPAQVEELKRELDFDSGLAKVLIPPGHPRRFHVDDPTFRDQFIKNIQRAIDPHLVLFIIEGCQNVPTRVLMLKPTRVGRPFRPAGEVETFVKSFLHIYFERAGEANSKSFRKKLRVATRHAVLLVTEAVRRSELAYVICA